MKKKINGIVGGISEQGIHIVCTEASINQIDENLKESVLLEYPLPLQIQSKLLSFSFDGNFISLVDDNKALVFDLQTKKISAEFLPAVISSSPSFLSPFLSLSPPPPFLSPLLPSSFLPSFLLSSPFLLPLPLPSPLLLFPSLPSFLLSFLPPPLASSPSFPHYYFPYQFPVFTFVSLSFPSSLLSFPSPSLPFPPLPLDPILLVLV